MARSSRRYPNIPSRNPDTSSSKSRARRCTGGISGSDRSNNNPYETATAEGCKLGINNVKDGISFRGGSINEGALIENCNFTTNANWGINNGSTGTSTVNAIVFNCGFGAGTQANTSGDISLPNNCIVVGTVNYASNVTPWNAPATGDFTITLAAAKNAGRGTFTETQASYTGTVGKPDIGAAQAAAGGGGGPIGVSGVM